MKVVIMAGGRGTRISGINSLVPKPMIPICGKPVLERQIEVLKAQGYLDIVIVTGHLGYIIENFFADGSAFGVNIRYIREEKPLGTGGALYFLKDEIEQDFLLLNGDIIFDVDIDKFALYHKKRCACATILTHPNSHPYDSGVIIADKHGCVVGWLHKEDEKRWYKNRVNAGLHMLSPEVLRFFTCVEKKDLDRDIFQSLILSRELSIYDSPEYVMDMGTPERYRKVELDIRSGKVAAKNLSNPQRAIFIDRDGTINRDVGFLTDIDSFNLLDGVSEAVRMINRSRFLAIVVTNQPVVARGEITLEKLEEIHNKMETLLGSQGAYLDDIFFCPHHPDKGFEGEIPEYKIKCDCRKPEPGLLLAAAEKYNIDLSGSWMLGDGENDVLAGKNAGCNVMSISKKYPDVPYAPNLLEAIKKIMNEEGQGNG